MPYKGFMSNKPSGILPIFLFSAAAQKPNHDACRNRKADRRAECVKNPLQHLRVILPLRGREDKVRIAARGIADRHRRRRDARLLLHISAKQGIQPRKKRPPVFCGGKTDQKRYVCGANTIPTSQRLPSSSPKICMRL